MTSTSPQSDIFHSIARMNAWIDNNDCAHMYPQENSDAMRILKTTEEIGEFVEALAILNGRASAAYIGFMGQNPRKGFTHDLTDVINELCDIAVTALCAVQHFTVDQRRTEEMFRNKLAAIIERSNIPDIYAPTPLLADDTF